MVVRREFVGGRSVVRWLSQGRACSYKIRASIPQPLSPIPYSGNLMRGIQPQIFGQGATN